MPGSVNARSDVSRAGNARDTRKDAMTKPRFNLNRSGGLRFGY